MGLLQLSERRTSVDQRNSVAGTFVIGSWLIRIGEVWMTWQREWLCCGEDSHFVTLSSYFFSTKLYSKILMNFVQKNN